MYNLYPEAFQQEMFKILPLFLGKLFLGKESVKHLPNISPLILWSLYSPKTPWRCRTKKSVSYTL